MAPTMATWLTKSIVCNTAKSDGHHWTHLTNTYRSNSSDIFFLSFFFFKAVLLSTSDTNDPQTPGPNDAHGKSFVYSVKERKYSNVT